MAEILFILVTLYAVYVVHNVVTGNQTSKEDSKVQSQKVPKNDVIATKEEVEVEVEVKAKPQKPVAKKVAVAKTKAKTKAATKPKAAIKPKVASKTKSKSDLPSGSVRNPETGEVAKIASNYRMTKRWIKDALVAEGLLDKVYKISEIDDAVTVKINQALDKFKVMDKYL